MPAPVDDFAREFAPPAPSGPFAPLVEKRLGELRRTAAAFAGQCWEPDPDAVPLTAGPAGYLVTPSGLLMPEGYGPSMLEDARRELARLRIVCGRLEAIADRLEGS